MALGKQVEIGFDALGIPGMSPASVNVLGRIDGLAIDTRPSNLSLTLTLRSYASAQQVLSGSAIVGTEESIVIGAQPVDAVEPILDPDTGDTLEPGVPGLPSLPQLLAQPLVTQDAPMATVGDLYNRLRAEIYHRIPTLRPHWNGASEV